MGKKFKTSILVDGSPLQVEELDLSGLVKVDLSTNEVVDTEPVEPLQSTATETVLTEETAKTYNFKKEVLILDDYNLIDRKVSFRDCELLFVNPVPVFSDTDKQIGTAVLSLSGRSLEADFFIDYSTPERLDVETKSKVLYPHLEAYSDVHIDKGTIYAKRLNISGIKLTLYPTNDSRIQPL